MYHSSQPGLTWIIPAYNEQDAIIPTVTAVMAELSKLDIPWEVIVINDGSRDATLERARSVDGIRILSHPINTGYGSAIKTGVRAARYDWIGIIDADGSYDIGSIPTLVAEMEKGFDMAVAKRANVAELDKPIKRALRRAVTATLSFVIAKRIGDTNSGLRIFTKELVHAFMPFLCNTFSFTTSISILALGQGFFVSYVPTVYAARCGKSKVKIRDAIRMMQLIIQGILYFNPLKVAIALMFLLIGGVWLPAELLAMAGAPDLADRFLLVGVCSAVLGAIGMLSDTIRITSILRGRADRAGMGGGRGTPAEN